MKKWIWIAIGATLLASAQCAARTSYTEKQAKAWQDSIEQRKRNEQRYAERIVRNTKLQTARKKLKRAHEAQEAAERQEQAQTQDAYRAEIRHFTQLTQDLALPIYTEKPIAEIIQEAQYSLEKLATYNPKAIGNFQAQLERALKHGKHPLSADGKKLYPNAHIMAQQSVQSLVDYTQHAQQLVEETASYAQETSNTIARTMEECRKTFVTLKDQLDASERRIQTFDAHLAQLNETLKKGELQAAQKEADAVNLAQCIDTFNTVSSKLSQDRITQTEQLVRTLEEKAHAAEQHTTILLLRLQEAERALSSVEKAIQKTSATSR